MLSVFNNKFGKNVPLTSIRRAMSDLTKDSQLVKTSDKIIGLFGLPEHQWQLKGANEPYQHIYRKGNSTAGDFATKILSTSTNKLVQRDMFEWDFDNDKK